MGISSFKSQTQECLPKWATDISTSEAFGGKLRQRIPDLQSMVGS